MNERMGNNRREYCKTHARNSISVNLPQENNQGCEPRSINKND